VPAADVRAAARLYATGGNGAIYYGLGVTEHSQGSTMVMGMANLAMATGNIGREGVGVNPLRGQNNVQGSCDMGSFPHEFPGYRTCRDDATREHVRERCGACRSPTNRACAFPTCSMPAIDGTFKGLYVQGEDIAQSDPNTAACGRGAEARWSCVVVQDLFLERDRRIRPCLPAGLVLPREGRHLHQRRAPHQPGAQGHDARWPG
jgi:formate dehydrogenase major subunit